MMIKITINDNDFEPALAGFCQDLSHGYPVPYAHGRRRE